MKRKNKITVFISIVIINSLVIRAQCSSLFSFAAYFETVTFHNQSNISNAHYFWNFGDGTGSNYKNPIHTFPESGNYLITLFSKDTISNCSAYYEYWINIAKYSTDICVPSITDSFYTSSGTDYLKIINTSTCCSAYNSHYDGGPALNFQWSWSINFGGFLNTRPYHMVCRGQYYDVTGNLKREAYKTVPNNYTSSKNYGNCSSNFEFTVVSQDLTGQRILFRAMNKTAVNYEWYISGFGVPITSSNDTISQFYPFDSNDLWNVGLMIKDFNNCYDTLFQNILVRNVQTLESINELTDNINLKLFPNPTSSILNITDEHNQSQNATIEIKNYLGQTVFTAPFSNQINISNLASGMYFLTVQNKENKRTVKIVKE